VAFALNPAQASAVEHFRGPMLVLAGAGSGKTRVITERIQRLIERGIPANQIVALTFTNKAAKEMHERVELRMKEAGHRGGAQGLTVSTFHSYGLATLSARARAEKRPFTIFDQGDQLALVKELLVSEKAGRAFDASAVVSRISNMKNARATPADVALPSEDAVESADEYDAIAERLYPRYEKALRNFSAYDFDDLVCEVARLWQTRPDLLEEARSHCRFLLVDEYQDTNPAQFELLRLLAGDDKNLCVVGDDDQAIYSWRGADVKNILQFETQFPGAKVVLLEENYRSIGPVLDVANAVISKKSVGHKKSLFTSKVGGEKPVVMTCSTPDAEAAWVANRIRGLVQDEKKRPREIAILYRSNGQAKAFEETLRAEGVSYRVVGGQQFFERKEVKDVLAYMKFTLNRLDEISLRRIVNTPARGIGDQSLDRLVQTALAKGWNLWEAIERIDSIDGISSAARTGCKELERLVAETRRDLLVERAHASVSAERLLQRVDMKKELETQSGSTHVATRRWGNIVSLLATFKKREAKLAAAGKDAANERDLGNFLHALTLQHDDEAEDPKDQVTLSTLHGAKGLEFDYVFLVGCEEGILPHSRTTDVKASDIDSHTIATDGIDEERRLFYVGVTRARKELVISHCKHRVLRGKPAPRTPSRFVLEIPEDLVTQTEAKVTGGISQEEMAALSDGLLAALMGD